MQYSSVVRLQDINPGVICLRGDPSGQFPESYVKCRIVLSGYGGRHRVACGR